jgi:alkylresorcinol/alkylpyrone synthase/polyketide synthase Type III
MKSSSEAVQRQPAILSVGTALPSERYSQEEIYTMACRYSETYRNPRVRQLFMNSDIDYRHLYLKSEDLKGLESSDELHARFRRGAIDIGAKAITTCLDSGKLDVADIDFIVVATCTGYLCPGLSPILMKELGFRNDAQRADLVGMGCAGAMPAMQRAYDFVRSYPEKKALVLTVEICSACYYFDDSLETMVGNAICADGAAALVIGTTDASPAPRIAGFKTRLEPSFLDSVGFEQHDGKLRIVLSKDIRDRAGELAQGLVTALLQDNGVRKEEIAHWIIHSGGRKVIDTIQREVGLTNEQVLHSRYVLKNFGNMSSPTVLFVLQETLRASNGNGSPESGDLGVMLALGPGLAIEGALLTW